MRLYFTTIDEQGDLFPLLYRELPEAKLTDIISAIWQILGEEVFNHLKQPLPVGGFDVEVINENNYAALNGGHANIHVLTEMEEL